jgi:hypothetical protein
MQFSNGRKIKLYLIQPFILSPKNAHLPHNSHPKTPTTLYPQTLLLNGNENHQRRI